MRPSRQGRPNGKEWTLTSQNLLLRDSVRFELAAVHPACLRLPCEGSFLDFVRLLRQHPGVKLSVLAWAACVVSALLVVVNLVLGLQTIGHPLSLPLQFRWFEALLPFMGLG